MPSRYRLQPRHGAGYVLLSAAALLMLACASDSSSSADNEPSYILHNAQVFTGDPAQAQATALAVAGDRIMAVGSDSVVLALAGDATTVINLEGRLVVPGLNDAHIHVGPFPDMRTLGLSGPDDPSWSTVLDSVRAAVADTPAGGWIKGEVAGAVFDNPRALRFSLDSVSPDHPVMLGGFTGHGLILNTAALAALNISLTEPDRPGGWFGRVSGTDTLDGTVWEYSHLAANRQLYARPSRADAVSSYVGFTNSMLRWGVTSVQLMEADRDINETFAALQESGVPLRWAIFEWPMPLNAVSDPRLPVRLPNGLPEHIRLAGVKWMLDGTPVERGAALRSPYADRAGWYGRVNFSHSDLRSILQAALADSGQLALHVAGDSTLALVLTTMTELATPEEWRTRRIRIEHGDGAMPDLLPLMQELGVVVVQNPTHVALPHLMHPRYGPELTPRMQLLGGLQRAGIPLALGTDAGGDARNPWLNLMLATIHPSNPAEALTREEALVAFTFGSAWAEGREGEKGRLMAGMLADIAVLSQNVLEVPPDALPATESLLTMIGGEIVHRAGPFAAN